MNISDIETPAVLIDAGTLDRNLRKMADYCKLHNLVLRPHTKTHKTPQIARMQVRYSGPGITVAKVSEAEVMVNAGITDIVVVYPIWGESKWKRLAALADSARISVAMDSLQVAQGISRAAADRSVEIGIRLEFDTGLRRCGLPLAPESMDVAREVMALPHLRWEGVSLYPGHVTGGQCLRQREIAIENQRLDLLWTLLDKAGIPYPVVSGGNTPAAYQSHCFHGVTEIRPGTYVFNDRNTVDEEAAAYTDCAATVLATVVSTSVSGRAIIDAGSKTLSADALISGERRHFGFILDRPRIAIDDLSEEHGHLLLTDGAVVRLGERLRVVPNHICPCINLHDRVFVISGQAVVEEWRVAGRGMTV